MSKLWNYLGKAFQALTSSGGSGAGARAQQEGKVLAFRSLLDGRVREELGLSLEQIGMIGMHTRQARQKRRSSFARLRALPEDKRREQDRRLRAGIADEVLRAVDKAGILNDKQQERLRQIVWQHRGARAFTDPAPRGALRLTLPQREAIVTIIEETSQKARRLAQGGNAGDEPSSSVAALRQEALVNALAVLSEEQKKRWEELKGPPFSLNLDGRDASPADETE